MVGFSDLSNEETKNWVKTLINNNKIHAFYTSTAWVKLRECILNEYKHECQMCKSRGFYTKATHVHHVQYVKRHPELALSRTYIYQGKEYNNLVPLCHSCHEEVHDYRQKNKKKPLTEERW